MAVNWNSLSQAQKFTRVFRIFKSITAGGAHGSIVRVNGLVNGVSTKLILDILLVNVSEAGREGARSGRFDTSLNAGCFAASRCAASALLASYTTCSSKTR